MPVILTKKSDTPGSIPSTANLTNLAGGAELAVNTADKRLFSMNSSSAIIEVGTNPSSLTCADASFTVARVGSLTISSLSLTNATFTSATITTLTSTSAGITTLTSSSATISTTLALSAGTANGVLYLNGSKAATSGSALVFDGTNLGLGVTPSAWSLITPMQIKNASFAGYLNRAYVFANSYFDGSNNKYIASDYATYYSQQSGQHQWYNAASGTAGNAITFTQAMTLDASGNLGVGQTSPAAARVHISAASTPRLRFTNDTTGHTDNDGTLLGLDSSQQFHIYNYENTAIYFGTNNAERARITSGGNFGIGTTSPDSKLVVKTGTNENLEVRSYSAIMGTGTGIALDSLNDARSSVVDLAVRGTNIALYGSGSTPMTFYTNSTERARITAAGDFWVGTTTAISPGGLTANNVLSAGTSSQWAAAIRNSTATTPWGLVVQYSAAAPNDTSSTFLYCLDNVNLRASIRSNGGLSNYQANNVDLSDARTKNSITPAASMWDKVGALEIVAYKYNDQTHDDVNLGVIAQQVESVEPVWVDNDGFGETPEGEEPLKTVYTKDIYFAAIKALQEAMARIEQLEAKVAALEA